MPADLFSPYPLSDFLTNHGNIKMEPIRMETNYPPRVIIFIGGTGYEIGWRFIEDMNHLLPGKLDELVQVLFIDTSEHTARRDVEAIAAGNMIYLPAFAAANVIDHLDENPYIREYWPGGVENPYDPAAHGNGTQRVRANSRLYLFNYLASTLMPAIREKINRAVLVKKDRVGTAALRVDLVGSIAGGTCSGMVIDLAYVVRLIAQEMLDNVFITANLVLNEAFKARSNPLLTDTEMAANAMATLLDINKLYITRDFRVRYNPLTTSENSVSNKRPFDFCYLIGLTNVDGKNLNNFEDVAEMCALKLKIEVLSQGKNHLVDVYDNIRGNQYTVAGQPTAYSSFAVGQIRYPYKGIASWSSLNKLEEFTRRAILKVDLSRSQMNIQKEVQAFLQFAQVEGEQANQLIERINLGEHGETLVSPSVSYDLVRETPEERLPGLLQSAEENAISELAALKTTIAANQPSIIRDFDIQLKNRLNLIFRSPNFGPRAAQWFLQELAKRLESQRDAQSIEQSQRLADLTNQKAAWETAHDAIEKAMRLPLLNIFRKARLSNARTDFATSLNGYLSAEHQHRLHTCSIEVLNHLIEITRQLYGQTNSIIQSWQEICRSASDRAGRELSKLQATHTDYTLIKNMIEEDGLKRACECYFPDLSTSEQVSALVNEFWAFFDQRVPGWRIEQADQSSQTNPAFQLYNFLAGKYVNQLRSRTLIEVMKETYGDGWRKEIHDTFEKVKPFWSITTTRYNADLQGIYQNEPTLIVYGEENEDWKDQLHQVLGENIYMVTDGDIHTLTILKTAHGLPLFAMRGIYSMKACYDYINSLWKDRAPHSSAIPLSIFPEKEEIFDFEPKPAPRTAVVAKPTGLTTAAVPSNGKSLPLAGDPPREN